VDPTIQVLNFDKEDKEDNSSIFNKEKMDMKAKGAKDYPQVDPMDLNNTPQMQFEVVQSSHQPIFDAASEKDILAAMGSLYVGRLQQQPLMPSLGNKTPFKWSPSWEPNLKQQDMTWSPSPSFSPLQPAFPFFQYMAFPNHLFVPNITRSNVR
jgi:hypothetical protein